MNFLDEASLHQKNSRIILHLILPRRQERHAMTLTVEQTHEGRSVKKAHCLPHLRVMGRSIRFLKSDIETFRALAKWFIFSKASRFIGNFI